MIVHIRLIKKDVYEHLLKTREAMFQDLFEKYKNDPEYVKYEANRTKITGRNDFGYSQACAWNDADAKTIGREIKYASDQGRGHPSFKRASCGCCHNMTVMMPILRPDGDYEITVEIDEEADDCIPD